MLWTEWTPDFWNHHRTLREVYATLPGLDQTDISPLVRALENPQSPFSLTGAVDLFGHDCIHILLGRGLLAQDEAFVIGFTMGNSKSLSNIEARLFKFVAHYLYPKEYRFSNTDIIAFDLGVKAGKSMGQMEIFKLNFVTYLDTPIWKLRHDLGIDSKALIGFFEEERRLIPESWASLRLPTSDSQKTLSHYRRRPLRLGHRARLGALTQPVTPAA